MRACAIIPAYEAEQTVGPVVRSAIALWPMSGAVVVVDDGSRDATGLAAREAGALVLTHTTNRGKGAALRTAMAFAAEGGFDVAVSIDADGQHPPSEALRLLAVDPDPEAIVLGVRDLKTAGAPRANQISNRISNFFLSAFTRRHLSDTQCGLRRYPLPTTLELGARDDGYAFEAEIILRAITARVRIVEAPVSVIYPAATHRVTHFDSVRDPARIVLRVVSTLALTRGLQTLPRTAFQPERRSAASERKSSAVASQAEQDATTAL